ncbi:MAG: glycosyltransferase family 9 protein [Bacteriovoracaceae bacterium]
MKLLIIRLSSFGDVVQCQACLPAIKSAHPGAEIHWLTKKQFTQVLEVNPNIFKVHSFDSKQGLIGWLKLCFKFKDQSFDVVYDAHSNIRTLLFKLIFRLCFTKTKIVTRSKERFKRILLFKFRLNKFPWPFKGMQSYIRPLQRIMDVPIETQIQSWDFEKVDLEKIQKLIPYSHYVGLAPSAAWEMKRWPLDYWKELIYTSPTKKFVVLGGPDDTFCEELVEIAPDRVVNLSGKLSLMESCYVAFKSSRFVSADTGLLHVADLLGTKTIALIGPTAFGFPSGEHVKTLEIDLNCRPCTKDGRGGCSQKVYKRCMVEIRSEFVKKLL